MQERLVLFPTLLIVFMVEVTSCNTLIFDHVLACQVFIIIIMLLSYQGRATLCRKCYCIYVVPSKFHAMFTTLFPADPLTITWSQLRIE